MKKLFVNDCLMEVTGNEWEIVKGERRYLEMTLLKHGFNLEEKEQRQSIGDNPTQKVFDAMWIKYDEIRTAVDDYNCAIECLADKIHNWLTMEVFGALQTMRRTVSEVLGKPVEDMADGAENELDKARGEIAESLAETLTEFEVFTNFEDTEIMVRIHNTD